MNLLRKAEAALAAHPNGSREEIAAHMQADLEQTSNALRQLRAQGRAFCHFKGRYSTWSLERPRPRIIINSVWSWGQCQS